MALKRSFLRQAAPLLISLVIVWGLTLMLRKFEQEAPRPFDRLIIEVLPEIPDLEGRSPELLERLQAAHGKLTDVDAQRDALVELARLYHANGLTRQAESCYLGLESFETEEAIWPYLLGVLKQDRTDQAAVATHFARSISLDPTNSLAYLRLGQAYLKGGLLEEARVAFEYRLLGSPQDGWAMTYLGQILMMEGKWADARAQLEQAREAQPSLGIVYELLPEACMELGDMAAARSFREQGERLTTIEAPADPALDFLGDYCFDADRIVRLAQQARSQRDFDRALELLQRALDRDVENEVAAEELRRVVAVMGEDAL